MSKNTPSVQTSLSSTAQSLVLWLVCFFVASAAVASFYFDTQSTTIKSLGWLILLPILTVMVLQTDKGKKGLIFLKETRMEFFKIVWPTRDEAIKTTWVVLALVLVMSIIIWLADNILMRVVQWLIGQ